MQEVKNEHGEREGIKTFGIFIPFLPKLLFKVSINFLRFKRRAKKAEKIFRKELIKQGLDKYTAIELTNSYMKGSQIKSFIQALR